jgi:hypothetical protein
VACLYTIIVLLVCALTAGCGREFPNAPTWSKSYILTWNGEQYDVTKETTENVDKPIGTVTFHGNLPTVFTIYAIKGVPTTKKIAVKTRDGYLVAYPHHN